MHHSNGHADRGRDRPAQKVSGEEVGRLAAEEDVSRPTPIVNEENVGRPAPIADEEAVAWSVPILDEEDAGRPS